MLHRASTAKTVIIVSYELRDQEDVAHFRDLKQTFLIQKIDNKYLSEDLRDDLIGLFFLKPKPIS